MDWSKIGKAVRQGCMQLPCLFNLYAERTSCEMPDWMKHKLESNCQQPLDHQKAREFQKNIYFCFTNYTKALDCVDHNKQWKILKEIGIPDHFTCVLKNLYEGQEATIRTLHGTTDCFKTEKRV